MLEEVISSLNLGKGGVVLDATIGGGGHAKEILKYIAPGGMLIGIDADEAALKIAGEAMKEYEGSFRLIKGNFRNLDAILTREGLKGLNAAIFDLGFSSYQIEDETRGFGMKHDARLDMRMDPGLRISAYEIVNRYKESDLSEIIDRFGEERFYKRIARAIVIERSRNPIETTQELARIVRGAIGFRSKRMKIDPATRTFQAIRIAVNDELGAIEEGVKKCVSWLNIGGRIAVISFHSLEDRIVKNLFKGYAGLGVLKILTKKPLRPANDEIIRNPRSRSAKLRAAERI